MPTEENTIEEEEIIRVNKTVNPLHPEHHSKDPEILTKPTSSKNSNPLKDFLRSNTSVHKAKDDDEQLIDIHIGNPLRRITELLEEIKRQKAFTFSIKGSLGVAGIVLVLGTFGIFGGTKALCGKGIQSKIGEVRVLKYMQPADESFWDYVPFVSELLGKEPHARIVMIDQNGGIVRLKGLPQNITIPASTSLIATGDFDACSSTLTIDRSEDVETF